MAIIDKPTDYFRIKLYAGNATNDTAITWDETDTNMQPDMLWFKSRTDTQGHALFDSVRGAIKRLAPNESGAEGDEATNLDSFDTNGFTVDSEAIVNGSSRNYVTWGWKAGGTAVSNTAGSITSSVSANTDSGFSIVKYTGTGANATVGHGLGVAPKMIIGKGLENTINWTVGGSNISSNWTSSLALNSTAAVNVANYWQDQAPNTNTFALTSDIGVNASGLDFIAYCFAEVKGFSKFGSYTGNGSANGTFVYTGFKPAFVIMKRSDSADNWLMKDSVRDSYNLANKRLFPNQSAAEDTSVNGSIDILSNGFKQRGSDTLTNASGGTYIYMAFAENPFVTSTTNGSIPATAR
jgi:hypothetical protein